MKSNSRLFPTLATVVLAAVLVLPSLVRAQGSSRAGTLEFILPITYSPSTSFDGEGGSSAKLNSDLGMGLGLGYNINDHLQLGGLITWSSRSYNATLINTDGTSRNGSGTMDSATIGLNATYFFMPSGFTPFVTGGIGSTFTDSNIPTGPGSTQCWWDPWYGYICNSYTPTKTQTAFSYTAGVGVRFDINRIFSLQGSYNKMWIDYSKGTPEIDGWKIDFVFRM
jgi:opacity protein-like surface antigen